MHNEMEICVIHAAFEDIPKIVATVDIPDDVQGEADDLDALEYAYRWTQNIHGSWSRGAKLPDSHVSFTHDNPDWNERVKRIADLPTHLGETLGLRSTSAGDFMSISTKDGQIRRYKVVSVGFDPVEDVDFPIIEAWESD